MSHDLVKFSMPSEFILARVLPIPCELAYGYRHGWLGRAEAVKVALAGYGVVPDPPVAYEELGLLLSDDLYRVPELIGGIGESVPTQEGCARVWLYLALAWVYENRNDYSDPLSIVEQLYADFEYPNEIEGFVRFMPPGEGQLTGEAAVYERWRAYLERVGAELRERRQRD
jgi:hypothetical protein